VQVIDFHNHFYPPEYLAAIQSGPSNVRVTVDDAGNPLVHYPGDYNILVPGHRDIAYRANVLNRAGVGKQILSFTTPGTHVESPQRAIELARMVNNAMAAIVRERRDQFGALATLPMNAPGASAEEFQRAYDTLGFRGAMLFSNINGVSLSNPRFRPLYECANARKAILYIHPTFPLGVEAMTDYWLMPLIGFTFDTTLAAAKLVFSGVTETYPDIRWVLCHLGGAIPYLAERLDRGYHAFSECREHIRKPPSEYLKQFYYDTVNFDPGALQLALDFAGADHLLAGSDYPHQIGSLKQMIASIDGMNLAEEQKNKIRGENAAKLLGWQVQQ
jgi:aminocarboxymuconate-semialdehyde decarboxylase